MREKNYHIGIYVGEIKLSCNYISKIKNCRLRLRQIVELTTPKMNIR